MYNVQGSTSLFIIAAIVFYASAAVSALPTASTFAASAITPDSARLNAIINANNESTTVTFQYSTEDLTGQDDPAIQIIAASPSPVTGSTLIPVSANLTSLAPGVLYFFRPVAVNGSGTTYGNTLSFTTTPAATATTEPATPVTTTNATLRGTVNPLNETTTVTFEYGPTISYGTAVTAEQSPVAGSADTQVSEIINGLIPSTTYHYRVVATNTYGTVYGEDTTFFTSAQAAPTVTTGQAIFSRVPNTATLSGMVNANNSSTTVTFEFGTTTSYGTAVTADQSPVVGSEDTPVSKYISGLTANTTYHYRVVGTNSEGTTYGADQTFYNSTSPYAATENASQIGNATATLNGTVNPKTLDGGPSSWTTTVTFEYGLTPSYGGTTTAQESPMGGDYNQNASAELTGLLPGTTYYYRIVADNINGTSSGEGRTFTTTSLPSAQTLTAAPVGQTTATLNGSVNPYGAPTTVTFEYGRTTGYGTTVTADQSPSAATSATTFSTTISGLLDNTTYHYRVTATNAEGSSFGEDRTFATGTPPPTVATEPATSISSTAAVLNGTVNANGLATSVGFEFGTSTTFERMDAADPASVSGTGTVDVSLAVASLSPGTTYYYRISATNDGGTVYGPIESFQTTAPPDVSTEAASSVTTTSARLNGTVNANDLSSTVAFEYGTTTAYGTSVTADQSPVTGGTDTPVSTALSGLTPSTTYHYRVVATNAAGIRYGEDRTFITTVGPPVVTTGYAVALPLDAFVNGTVNASNSSTTVSFEYGTTTAYGSTVTAEQSPVNGSTDTAVSATLSGLAFNTTYHYRVVATNGNGTANGADMTFKTTLDPTAITQPATDIRGTYATLNGGANANGGVWSVRFDYGTTTDYGSDISAMPDQVSGSTTTPVSADISGLAPNTTYHYRAVVYSGGFNYYGADHTFTTSGGPAVTTNSASLVAGTEATLNATVGANDTATSVLFEYGLDTSYGKSIAASPSPVTGTAPTAVSSRLLGLTPLTTYHYRAVASSAEGTVYGADMTFTTGGVAPAAATEAASSVELTSAVFNGTVDASNDSTTVAFEYGLTESYGATVTADQSPLNGTTPSAVQASVSGLAANTLYNYRVVAQNSSGTARGDNVTFFTSGSSPVAVTRAAGDVNSTDAVLHGTVTANNNTTQVFFEIGTDTAYGRSYPAEQSPVTGSMATAVSAALSGVLEPETIYHFRVVGQSAAGTSYGEDMTFFTKKQFPWQVLLPGLVSPNRQQESAE